MCLTLDTVICFHSLHEDYYKRTMQGDTVDMAVRKHI